MAYVSVGLDPYQGWCVRVVGVFLGFPLFSLWGVCVGVIIVCHVMGGASVLVSVGLGVGMMRGVQTSLGLCSTVRIGETGEKRTSGARDAASATQAECCALHHMRVPYLSDGVLAVLSRRRGGNLVNIRTSCIRL